MNIESNDSIITDETLKAEMKSYLGTLDGKEEAVFLLALAYGGEKAKLATAPIWELTEFSQQDIDPTVLHSAIIDFRNGADLKVKYALIFDKRRQEL